MPTTCGLCRPLPTPPHRPSACHRAGAGTGADADHSDRVRGQRAVDQNPFTYDERRHFIEACYRHEIATDRIVVAGCSTAITTMTPGSPTSAHRQRAGPQDRQPRRRRPARHRRLQVGLAGYKKDGSSYYLKMFPDWGAIDIRRNTAPSIRPTSATTTSGARRPCRTISARLTWSTSSRISGSRPSSRLSSASANSWTPTRRRGRDRPSRRCS